MAGSMNLKPFYLGLAVVAVAGASGIWWAARSGGGGGYEAVEPVPVAAGSFAGYVLGSDSAPVEIHEYADFQCPACAHFAILTGTDLKQRLVATGQVRWRFFDFPLPGHQNARAAHHAAACAGEQDQFWTMHDQLFFAQQDWSTAGRPERKFRDYGRAIGLDLDRFDDCMDSRRYAGRIEATKQGGVNRGVSATPTFIIGRTMVSGSIPYDTLKSMVERATP